MGGENEERGEEEEEEEVEKAWLPRVWLVEPTGFNDYDLISEDIIEMRDSDRLQAHHYHLVGIPLDSLYFLLGSRDMIEVRLHACLSLRGRPF